MAMIPNAAISRRSWGLSVLPCATCLLLPCKTLRSAHAERHPSRPSTPSPKKNNPNSKTARRKISRSIKSVNSNPRNQTSISETFYISASSSAPPLWTAVHHLRYIRFGTARRPVNQVPSSTIHHPPLNGVALVAGSPTDAGVNEDLPASHRTWQDRDRGLP